MLKVQQLLYSFFTWLWIYPLWSQFCQLLYDRSYVGAMPRWINLEPLEVQTILDRFRWQADTWKEGFDRARHWGYIHHVFNEIIRANMPVDKKDLKPIDPAERLKDYRKTNPAAWLMTVQGLVRALGQPKGSLDCEDYAAGAASMLDRKYRPRILTVAWKDGPWPWSIKGHAVCFYSYEKNGQDFYGYIGNWTERRGLASEMDAVYNILGRAGKNKELVGHHIYMPEELAL